MFERFDCRGNTCRLTTWWTPLWLGIQPVDTIGGVVSIYD
jgi:hypothetical protein